MSLTFFQAWEGVVAWPHRKRTRIWGLIASLFGCTLPLHLPRSPVPPISGPSWDFRPGIVCPFCWCRCHLLWPACYVTYHIHMLSSSQNFVDISPVLFSSLLFLSLSISSPFPPLYLHFRRIWESERRLKTSVQFSVFYWPVWYFLKGVSGIFALMLCSTWWLLWRSIFIWYYYFTYRPILVDFFFFVFEVTLN